MTETFAQYSARLLSLAADADPFVVLTSTPGRLAQLIAGRSPTVLQWTPAADRWSVAQILSHLADSEIVFAYRLRRILAAPGMPLEPYDQDAWSRAQHAQRSDGHGSLAVFAPLRAGTVALLRSLTDEELDRYGVHAERGKESIRHLLRLYSGHDRNHLAQIEQLLAERPA